MSTGYSGLPEDRYAEVGGVRLRYWSQGKGEDVLLLHGLGGSIEDWTGAFEYLGNAFRIWAVELPGCDLSDKPQRGYSINYFVRTVTDFLDIQHVKWTHVIGVSMGGGGIGLVLSSRKTSRVGRLVLVNSALLGRRLHPFLHLCTVPLLGELLLRSTPSMVERYINWCAGNRGNVPSKWVVIHKKLATLPGAKQAFLAILRSANGLLGTTRHELRPVLSALPQFPVETLIIYGGQDRFIPQRYSRRAANRIPKAQLVSFPNCGHIPHIESPERFYPLVSTFLDDGINHVEDNVIPHS